MAFFLNAKNEKNYKRWSAERESAVKVSTRYRMCYIELIGAEIALAESEAEKQT